jgi:hypothetical protein
VSVLTGRQLHWEVDTWVGSYEAIAAGELEKVSDALLQITGVAPMRWTVSSRSDPRATIGCQPALVPSGWQLVGVPESRMGVKLTKNALLVEVPSESHAPDYRPCKTPKICERGPPMENIGKPLLQKSLAKQIRLAGSYAKTSGIIEAGASALRAGHSAPRA